MKKSNLSKYILFVFISFLTFVGVAFAESFTVAPGDTHPIRGTNCSVTSGTAILSPSEVKDDYYTFNAPADAGGETGEISCDNTSYTYTISSNNGGNNGGNSSNGGSTTIRTEKIESVISLVGGSKIVSYTHNEYLQVEEVACPDGNGICDLKVKPTSEGKELNINGTVTITYIDSNGNEVTKTITLELDSFMGARAFYGGAQCGFDSNWTRKSYDNYNFYQGNGSATLPSCTMQSVYGELTFKGWQQGDNRTVVKALGQCDGAVSAGTNVTNGDYSACFEGRITVQLAVNDGNIDNLSDWQYANGRGYIYVGSGDKAKLPNLVFTGFDKEKTFKEWTNGTTTAQPGDEVELNGDVWRAVVETTSVTNRDYHKRIYIGKTEDLYVEGITGCSTSASELTANWDASTGKCSISGLSATTSEVDVNVQVGSDTMTFKFTVLSNSGLSQNGDSDFIIETDANVNYDIGNETIDDDGIIRSVPEKFKVTWTSGANPSHTFKIDGNIGNSLMYEAIWPENGVDKAHVAFCLDPGRWGPGGGVSVYIPSSIDYEVTESMTGQYHGEKDVGEMPEDLSRIVTYVVDVVIPAAGGEAGFHQGQSEERAAANVAIRLVAANNGVNAGSEGGSLETHYKNYNEGAAAIKALTNYNASTISDVLRSKLGLTQESLISKIATYLVEYKGHDLPEKISGDVERTIDTREAKETGGNNYEVHYTGTLILPSGVTTAELDPTECNNNSVTTGVTCSVATNPLTLNSEESNSEGATVFDYDITLIVDSTKVKQPKDAEEKKKISFKLKYGTNGTTINDVYLASPIGNYNGYVLQRMLVFDMSADPNVYIYFNPIPNECLELDILNPDNCTESSCDLPTFNKDLFKNSGCCSDILDESSIVAQKVCLGKCTTSTFASVCKYPENDEQAESGELYQIKEGSLYSSGSYSNNIGECIVNVSDEFKTETRGMFDRTDDNGNSINVESYSNNEYCAVTCKEDWILTMDTFGNYVGPRAVAAGTWFQILNDIFIGGSRTCYTSYIDYDKYMDDLTKESNIIVENYNKYNLYSRQYTDITKQQSDTSLRNIGGSNGEAKCVKRDTCTNSNPDSDKYSMSSNEGQCVASRTADGPYPDDPPSTGTHYKCAEGETLDGTTCKKNVDAKCLIFAREETFELSTSASGVSNTINEAKDTYTIKLTEDQVDTVFGGVKKNTQTSLMKNEIENYKRTENIVCTITEAETNENDTGSIVCKMNTVSSVPGDAIAEKQFPQEDIGDLCKETVTVKLSDGTDQKFCKCNSSDNSNNSCDVDNVNYDQAKENAFDFWSEQTLEHIEKKADGHSQSVTNSHNKIYKLSEYMFDCQHFLLYNTSDDTKVYEYYDKEGKHSVEYAHSKTDSGIILGNTRDFVQINTAYNPVGDYHYDETGFMAILGQDNILVPDMARNDKELGESYVSATDKENKTEIIAFDKYGKKYGVGGEDVFISRNKIETNYYSHDNNSNSKWSEDDTPDNWKNYNDGSSDSSDPNEVTKVITMCTIGDNSNKFNLGSNNTYTSVDKNGASESNGYELTSVPEANTQSGNFEWNGGTCYQVNVKYYKSHYISSKISNSSFYKNKGNWYQRGNDIKEHGDTWELALQNANSRKGSTTNYSPSTEKGHWSVMGTKNVFPISMTTPRNLYQYTYTFKDIGSYSDGRLGRIMGDEESIIKLNSRSCFYEVYEEMCLCCGSKINSYVEGSQEVTKDFIDDNNFGYNQIYGDEIDRDKTNGILNVVSSSVSLNDLSSNYNSGRVTPVNWSNNSPFFYNGTTYFTDKGDVALKEIEVKGETAYSETPEYSYLLTPSTLSAIRDYNSSNGYEVNFNNLEVYGRYTIEPVASCSGSGCDWGDSLTDFEKDNNYITFRHYGSKFLENEMEDYGAVYDGTISRFKDKNSNVCYVVQGDVNLSDNENELASKVQSDKCRWVDYISTNGGTFRLAFK